MANAGDMKVEGALGATGNVAAEAPEAPVEALPRTSAPPASVDPSADSARTVCGDAYVPEAPDAMPTWESSPVESGAFRTPAARNAAATIKVNDGKGGTIELSREVFDFLKEYNAAHKGHEIPVESLPHLLFGAAGVRTEKNLMERMEKRFTLDAVEKWLESDAGRKWSARNEALLGKTFKHRLAVGGPSLLMSVGGLLGAEEIADIIGLDPVYHRQERFAFVVYTMHGSGKLGQMGMRGVMRSYAGVPAFAFGPMERAVLEGGEEGVKIAFIARTRFGLAAMSTMMRNLTAGKVVVAAGRGLTAVATMPVKATFGLGPGLLAQDAAVSLLIPHASAETKATVGLAAFMAPEAWQLLASKRLKDAAASRVGAPLAALAYAETFAFAEEMGLSLYLRARDGEDSAYLNSVSARAAWAAVEAEQAKQWEAFGCSSDEGWYSWHNMRCEIALDIWTVRRFCGERLPLFAAMIWQNSADASFTVDAYHEDELGSRAIQKELPARVRSVLISGIGNERDTPAFYRSVDLDGLTNVIELEDPETRMLFEAIEGIKANPTEGRLDAKAREIERAIDAAANRIFGYDRPEERDAAFRTIEAVKMQQDMAALGNIMLPMNGNWAYVAKHDGTLRHEGWLSSVWTSIAHAEEKDLHTTSWWHAALSASAVGGFDLDPLRRRITGVARAVTDADGRDARNSDYENQYLKLAFPPTEDDPTNRFGALSPDEARTTILQMRKVGLLMRILEADARKRPKMMALAQEVGLADGDGRIIPSDISLVAYRAWALKMRAGDEGSKAALTEHIIRLRVERQNAHDLKRTESITFELAALTMDANKSRNEE